MEKSISKYPLVIVEWADAQSETAWDTKEKVFSWAEKSTIIQDIGWLIGETKLHIIICSQICKDDGDLGNRTKIPKAWVVSKKKVRVR